MSRQTELTRITNAKAAIVAAIEGKGVTVPDGTLLDGMAALIESIEAGGGGSGNFATGTFTTTDDITSNIVINHNLGVKPKFIIVASTDVNAYTGSSAQFLSFYYIYQYSSIYYGHKYQTPNKSNVEYNHGKVIDSGYGTTGGWYRVNVDETTFTLKQAKISSTYGIGASHSFFWIAYGE